MAVPRRYTQPKYDYRAKKRKKSTSWKDRVASFAESRKRHFADILAVKKAKAEKASAKAKAPPKKKDWYDLKEEEKTDPDAFGKHQYEESKKSPHKSVRKSVKAGAKRRGIIPTKTVKTKGGDYGVYAKKSRTAQSFRDAFRDARKSGQKVFEWKGKKYSSALKKKKVVEKKKKWIADPEGSDMQYENLSSAEQTERWKKLNKKKKKKVMKIN